MDVLLSQKASLVFRQFRIFIALLLLHSCPGIAGVHFAEKYTIFLGSEHLAVEDAGTVSSGHPQSGATPQPEASHGTKIGAMKRRVDEDTNCSIEIIIDGDAFASILPCRFRAIQKRIFQSLLFQGNVPTTIDVWHLIVAHHRDNSEVGDVLLRYTLGDSALHYKPGGRSRPFAPEHSMKISHGFFAYMKSYCCWDNEILFKSTNQAEEFWMQGGTTLHRSTIESSAKKIAKDEIGFDFDPVVIDSPVTFSELTRLGIAQGGLSEPVAECSFLGESHARIMNQFWNQPSLSHAAPMFILCDGLRTIPACLSQNKSKDIFCNYTHTFRVDPQKRVITQMDPPDTPNPSNKQIEYHLDSNLRIYKIVHQSLSWRITFLADPHPHS